MINILKTAILVLIAFNLTGCVKELPEQTIKGKDVVVEPYSKVGSINEYKFSCMTTKYDVASVSEVLSLKEASYLGKSKGFKYFSVNALSPRDNEFRNNEFIPITSIEEYLIFKGQNGVIGKNNDAFMTIPFFVVSYKNEKDDKAFYWNVDKVLNEEVVLYNPYSKKDKLDEYNKANDKIKEAFAGTSIKYKILDRE